MRTVLVLLILSLSAALGADDEKPATRPAPTSAPVASIRKSAQATASEFDNAREAEVLAFVREHHPELATVLEALKPMNPVEYRKAIVELSGVSRTLADLKARNPGRHSLALDAWKAKSRVELAAAQLAGSPSEELKSQLRLAIEAKLDVEIRRQRFELEQAEVAARRARDSIERLDTHRDAIIEARFRALQPKKSVKSKKTTETPATKTPVKTPAQDPIGEDRR